MSIAFSVLGSGSVATIKEGPDNGSFTANKSDKRASDVTSVRARFARPAKILVYSARYSGRGIRFKARNNSAINLRLS